MSSLSLRVGRVVTRQGMPLRAMLWAAMVLAFVTVILTTHVRILRPTLDSIVQASNLYHTQQQAEALREENLRLEEIRQYLGTPAGRDLAVRGKVYALKPGERLILVEEPAPSEPPPPTWSGRVWGGLERAQEWVAEGVGLVSFVTRALVLGVDLPTKDKPVVSGQSPRQQL